MGIAPAPAWIVPVTPGGKAPAPKEFSEGYYVSFMDTQVNLDLKTTYSHTIRQIALESGVQNGSEISVVFDPSYERIVFHHITIFRDGKAISQLKASDFKVMPLETDRQRFIYNGYYSASLILNDIRKGDRIDYAFSRIGWNPVFQNKYSDTFRFGAYEYLPHSHYALLAPAGRQLQFKDFNNPPKKTTHTANGSTIYEWNLTNAKSVSYEDYTPSWLTTAPFVQITEYKSWKEVADWGLAFYQIQPLSGPLKAKTEEWKKQANGSTYAYIEMAIRFVQDEIRYLGIETGENSHRPHSPEQVFGQRYGDCKDKAFLLCAILRENDIEADPVLVDTYKTSRLSEYLPTPLDFNHVVVRIRVNDPKENFKSESPFIFIDATYSVQGGTTSKFSFPAYGQGLILKKGQNLISDLPIQNPGNVVIEEEFVLPSETDSTAEGFLMVKSVYYEGEADNIRGQFQQNNLSEMEEGFLNYYRDTYPHASFEARDTVEYYDQREANNFSIVERYVLKNLWKYDDKQQKYIFPILGKILYNQLVNLPNRPRTSPVALRYPYHITYTIRLRLPNAWNVPTDSWKIKREAYEIIFQSRFIAAENTWELIYDYTTLADHVTTAQTAQFKEDMAKLIENLEYELTYPDTLLANTANLNGWMILLFVLTLVFGIWVSVQLHKHSSEPEFATGTGIPIGGWLNLLAISLCIKPVSLIIRMADNSISVYFTQTGWEVFSGYEDATVWVYRLLLVTELIFNTLLVVGSVLLVVLFFKRRNSFPYLFSAYTGGNLAFLIVNTLACVVLFPSSSNEEAMRDILGIFIFGALWISYLYKSQRARQTFVNFYDEQIVTELNTDSEVVELLE